MAVEVHAPLLDEDDDALVGRFQAGDMQALDALLTKYRRFARSKVRNYFLVGADADDLEQEGLIGLYKAARDYRADRAASFPVFAEMCITRQIITAVKAATRQKHQPLNGYVSISTPLNLTDEGADPRDELLRDHTIIDPADVVVDVDQAESVQVAIAQLLSSLEVDVLKLYVGGASVRRDQPVTEPPHQGRGQRDPAHQAQGRRRARAARQARAGGVRATRLLSCPA